MSSSDGKAKLEALKKEILSLGFVRPGSLVRRFMPCGNARCRCMAKPPQLHGPYYEWSYKVAGKTKTRRLTEEQVKLCQEWLRDHKTLKRIVRQMERLSLTETDRTLGEISKS
jgi:hypothetical protein